MSAGLHRNLTPPVLRHMADRAEATACNLAATGMNRDALGTLNGLGVDPIASAATWFAIAGGLREAAKREALRIARLGPDEGDQP